jgi:hypothetical protein
MSSNTAADFLTIATGNLKRSIHLVRRNVYGKQLTYPDCANSQLIAQVFNVKTFTSAQVEAFRDVFIGFGVAVNITESSK